MKDFFRKHFGFKGRMRRRTYIIKALLFLIVCLPFWILVYSASIFRFLYYIFNFNNYTYIDFVNEFEDITGDVSFFSLLLFPIMSIFYIPASIRRLHDIGLKGVFISITLPIILIQTSLILHIMGNIMGINGRDYILIFLNTYISENVFGLYMSFFLIFVIFLCLYPGTKGANKYGEDPRITNNARPDNIYNPEVSDNNEDKA